MVTGVSGYENYYTASLASARQTIFDTLDQSGDGGLDLSELAALAGNSGVSTDQIMTEMDTDQDGLICKTEIDSFMAKMEAQMIRNNSGMAPPPPPPGEGPSADEIFSMADANEDGSIDADELEALLGQTGLDVDSIFADMDSDEDGLISSAEFNAAMDARQAGGTPPAGGGASAEEDEEEDYAAADLNEDGYVSTEELAAYLAQDGGDFENILAAMNKDEAGQTRDWKTELYFSMLQGLSTGTDEFLAGTSLYV